jgi:hypothetical protein
MSWFDQQGAPSGGGTPWGGSPPIAAPPGGGGNWFASQGAPGPMTAPGAPAGPGGPAPVGGPAAPPPQTTNRDEIRAWVAAEMQRQGQTPGGRGSGPGDLEYYVDQIQKEGGLGQGYDWGGRIARGFAGTQAPLSGQGGGGGMPNLGLDPSAAFRLGYEGDWTTDPGYQFRMEQGQQAIERGAAAKGTLLTGGTLKGLTRYAQGVGSDEFQRRYQRLLGEQQNRFMQLSGLAGIGANAAAGQAGQNAGYADTAGNLITGGGNAAAAGTVGSANAWQSGINNATNLAQQYYLLRMLQPGAAPGVAPAASGGYTPQQGTAGAPLVAGNPYQPGFFGWGSSGAGP